MSDIKLLTSKIRSFRDKRNWQQFHNPKDAAISLTLEATELLEHFQWKTEEEMETYVKTHKKEIGEELADILYWVLLMSFDFKIDIVKASTEKLKKNAHKYPIKKVKGKAVKYEY